VDAELWAGNIGRVMDQHFDGISEEDLAAGTGLTPEQIELGVLWQNLDWHQRFGKGEGPQPEG